MPLTIVRENEASEKSKEMAAASGYPVLADVH